MAEEIINFSEDTYRALGTLLNDVIVHQAVAIAGARACIAALARDTAGTEADFLLHDPEHVAEMAMTVMKAIKGDTQTHGVAVKCYGEDLRAAFCFAEQERRERWLAAPPGPRP